MLLLMWLLAAGSAPFTSPKSPPIPIQITVPTEQYCSSSVVPVVGDPGWVGSGNEINIVENGTEFIVNSPRVQQLYIKSNTQPERLIRDSRYTLTFTIEVSIASEYVTSPKLLVWRNTPAARELFESSNAPTGNISSDLSEPEINMNGQQDVLSGGIPATYSVQFTATELLESAEQSLWVFVSFITYLPTGFRIKISDWCVTKNGLVRNPPEALPYYSEVFEILNPPRPEEKSMTEQINCPFNEEGIDSWSTLEVTEEQLVVRLPENKRILLKKDDVPPEKRFELIQVPDTSQLIFADEEITITVRALLIYGRLRIGGPGCRLQGPIKIIFWGKRTDPESNLAGFGSKGMAALGVSAHVDMYGRRYYPTWTRLARMVRSGDDRAYLQKPVNWHVGHEVVLTTTVWDDTDQVHPQQNEVHVIKAVGSGGTVIQFEKPVMYSHYAGTEYQGEIALLTRSVSMEGEPSLDGFGGHSVVSGVRGRFAGVGTRYMGQTNVLAKYPFHFHLIGKDSGSLISDCVARDTYFRCYTIHGTSGALVNENIAFNVTGNCIYIEDGVEEDNVFSYNLVSFVKPIGAIALEYGQDFVIELSASGLDSEDRVFPADASASCFYVSNAYNEFIGNVASGGWVGYSFPSLPTSVGIYQNERLVQPRSRPVKKFSGNTCHSSSSYGSSMGCIYVGSLLHYQADSKLHYTFEKVSRSTVLEPGFSSTSQTPEFMKFNNTLIYANSRGVLHWGTRVEVTGFEFHDVTNSLTVLGEAWVNNGIINSYSSNVDAMFKDYHREGFRMYNDSSARIIISNVEFRNYNSRVCKSDSLPQTPGSTFQESACTPTGNISLNFNAVWLSSFTSDAKPSHNAAAMNISFSDIDYESLISFKIANTGTSRMFNMVDYDGSATLEGRPTIVGSNLEWWNICSDCRFEPSWSVWLCPKKPAAEGETVFEEREVIYANIQTPDISETNGGLNGECKGTDGDYSNCDVGTVTLWGNDPNRSMRISSNPGLTGISGSGWHLQLDAGAAKYLTIQPAQVPTGVSFRLSVAYPVGTTFTITGSHSDISDVVFTESSSLEQFLQDRVGSSYFFDGNLLFLSPSLPSSLRTVGFNRSGTVIEAMQMGYVIHVRASCNSNSQGFCDSTPRNVIPTWNVSCPVKPVSTGPVVIPSSSPSPPATSTPTVGIADNYNKGDASSPTITMFMLISLVSWVVL